MSPKLRPIAIHLPQFHPIPENDLWWGRGFTEWTNVTKARPRFKGHYQPHLPADLGFYDLRLHESRVAQAELAKEYGIYGFCYYHYWFNGKLILEKPLEGILKEKSPDFPFMLCWANENWSRNWDGQFKNVLLEQTYTEKDDRAHIQYLFKFFEDERYIRVEGKPVFVVYRTELFPDVKRAVTVWREEAARAGIGELYLIMAESFTDGIDPTTLGFDAAFEFQPNWRKLSKPINPNLILRVTNKLGIYSSAFSKNHILDYGKYVDQIISEPKPSYKRFRGVTPMWDNSARRKQGALIFNKSSPEKYGQWLNSIVNEFVAYSPDESFVFINAWNEWAEGNHLEPCQKWGKAYLEVTKRIISAEI